jgi:hypothetical protein
MTKNKSEFHPRLFNTPMVKSILSNRKTQTRRTDGLEEINNTPQEWIIDSNLLPKNFVFREKNTGYGKEIICPYNIGDVLWVKETYIPKYYTSGKNLYRADDNNIIDASRNIGPDLGYKWTPSIFMKKVDCRLFLKIKSIRVERLNAISEEDAIKEGIKIALDNGNTVYFDNEVCFCLDKNNVTNNPKHAFKYLWESINGKESWYFNPFVWVYEFEQIEKPLDFIA